MAHILLIDDDPDILEIIRLELEDDLDNRTDFSSSAADAIDKIQKNHYDVIITDWKMPVMNGTALVRKIRSLGCSSVVVIYSGLGMGQDISEALASGANYYLHRKGDPEKEFARLKELIQCAGTGK